MNSNLLFEFEVNKDKNSIHVTREFHSNLALVWKAWTTAELLDHWWGPKPWRAETKEMDFTEGGHWLYAMVGPEGEKHWSKANYISIVPEKSFRMKDMFCDENGIMNSGMPQNLWKNDFIPSDGKVSVQMVITFDTLAALEQILEMGFREGFTQGLNQLDELLAELR